MLTGKSMAMVNTYSISIKIPADNAFQLVRLLIESWAGGSIILGRGLQEDSLCGGDSGFEG